MEFETAKILLGVGLILVAIGWLSFFVDVGAVYIVGVILALIGAYGVSEAFNNRDIFNNLLYSVMVSLVGLVVLMIAGVTSLIAAVPLGMLSGPWPLLAWGIALLLGIWVVIVIAMWFEARTYNALRQSSGVEKFGAASKLVRLGALLAIILVGFIVILVGRIFAIVGVFELRKT